MLVNPVRFGERDRRIRFQLLDRLRQRLADRYLHQVQIAATVLALVATHQHLGFAGTGAAERATALAFADAVPVLHDRLVGHVGAAGFQACHHLGCVLTGDDLGTCQCQRDRQRNTVDLLHVDSLCPSFLFALVSGAAAASPYRVAAP